MILFFDNRSIDRSTLSCEIFIAEPIRSIHRWSNRCIRSISATLVSLSLWRSLLIDISFVCCSVIRDYLENWLMKKLCDLSKMTFCYHRLPILFCCIAVRLSRYVSETDPFTSIIPYSNWSPYPRHRCRHTYTSNLNDTYACNTSFTRSFFFN